MWPFVLLQTGTASRRGTNNVEIKKKKAGRKDLYEISVKGYFSVSFIAFLPLKKLTFFNFVF